MRRAGVGVGVSPSRENDDGAEEPCENRKRALDTRRRINKRSINQNGNRNNTDTGNGNCNGNNNKPNS